MTSRRTKTLFWLSAIPPIFVVGAGLWTMTYSFFLSRTTQATYFLIFHAPWLRVLAVSGAFFVAGLISLLDDGRKRGKT